jgi:hypothetical protein
MKKSGIGVHAYGDWDGSGLKKAKRDIDDLGTNAKGFSSSFSKSMLGAGAAIGAAFSVGAIGSNVIDFFKDSMTAALADEKAMRSLEIALQNVGAAHQVAPVEKFIDALARETGVADDQLRPAFQKLVTATEDVGLSQQNLQLAMDISAGTGRDLEAVTLALARAYTGSTTGLSRLGAGLDANLLKSKDMDKITAVLSDRFSGQAAAAADTYQGKINKLNIAVDEGKELIGVALLDAVNEISEAFGGTGGMADTVDTASQAVADFIRGVSLTIKPVTDLSIGLDTTGESAFGFFDALKQSTRLIPPLNTVIQITQALLNKGADSRISTEKQANALQKLKGEYISASGAMIGVVSEQARLRGALDATTVAVVNQFSAMSLLDQKMQDAGTRAIVMANNDAAARRVTATTTTSVGTSSAAAAKDVFTFKEALAQVNSEGLEKLNANLKVAQDEFDGFRDSVASGLTGQLNVEDAFKTLTKRESMVAEAQKELNDYRSKITGEATETQLEQLAKLQGAYDAAAAAAANGAKTVVGEFVAQSGGIVEFGNQLNALLLTDLSPEAFNLVREQTAAVGSMLASELLGANGATLIAEMNTAVAAVETVALAVGEQSATKFFGLGVKNATDTITGFKEYMGKDGLGRKKLMKVMDNLADAATREVRIDVQVTRSINEVIASISSGVTSGGVPGKALGGPVSSGRPYIVGEVGPELFVPSSSGNIVPNNKMGGSVINLTVNAGMGTQGAEVGRQIVDALKAYERRNGSVYVSA